jgi:hypothetical protein
MQLATVYTKPPEAASHTGVHPEVAQLSMSTTAMAFLDAYIHP